MTNTTTNWGRWAIHGLCNDGMWRQFYSARTLKAAWADVARMSPRPVRLAMGDEHPQVKRGGRTAGYVVWRSRAARDVVGSFASEVR